MAYVNQPEWAALTAKGAIPMMVTRTFIFDGVRYDPGHQFVCGSPIKMRQLYEQRMIHPSVSVAEALQQATAKPSKPPTPPPVQEEMRHPVREVERSHEPPPAKPDTHSQGRKKHGS